METGGVAEVCGRPAHPYTRSLLSSVPVPDVAVQRERRRVRSAASVAAHDPTAGASPLAVSDGVGCPFAPRCPYAQEQCVVATPPLVDVGDGRQAACVRLDEIPTDDPLSGLRRPSTAG
jgi:oligopeptide/dipeptide ABC transporter ATP-binding protein